MQACAFNSLLGFPYKEMCHFCMCSGKRFFSCVKTFWSLSNCIAWKPVLFHSYLIWPPSLGWRVYSWGATWVSVSKGKKNKELFFFLVLSKRGCPVPLPNWTLMLMCKSCAMQYREKFLKFVKRLVNIRIQLIKLPYRADLWTYVLNRPRGWFRGWYLFWILLTLYCPPLVLTI